MTRNRRGTKLPTFERLEYTRLMGVVRRVRNRWRLRTAIAGLAVAAVAALATLVVATWGLAALRYRPSAAVVLSLVTYAVLAWIAYRWVVRPFLRRLSNERVALYLEEKCPQLDATVLAAVEFGDPERKLEREDVSPGFVERVVESALARSRQIGYGKKVDEGSYRRLGGMVGGSLAVVAAVLLIDPAFLRNGASMLLMPWARGASASSPYAINVVPGNAEIARGGTQEIRAELLGFDAEQVEISLSSGEGDWERLPMSPDADRPLYSFMLFDVREQTDYFVEANGVRSEVHRLDVVDVPYVDQIDLQLSFPSYGGLDPETIEDGGDIAALEGTEVELRVTPNGCGARRPARSRARSRHRRFGIGAGNRPDAGRWWRLYQSYHRGPARLLSRRPRGFRRRVVRGVERLHHRRTQRSAADRQVRPSRPRRFGNGH